MSIPFLCSSNKQVEFEVKKKMYSIDYGIQKMKYLGINLIN